MPSQNAIAAIIARALPYCRSYTPEQTEGAIQLWTSVFKDTPSQDLLNAVDEWARNLTQDSIRGRAQTLPLPGDLMRIMDGHKTRPPDRRPTTWTPAGPDYKAAHVEAGRKIAALGGGVRPLDFSDLPTELEHQHDPPTFDDDGNVVSRGNEDCARCNQEPPPSRREEIAAILSTLPEPSLEARACRCDGSGIVDTTEALEEILSLGWGERAVFPCPACNQAAYERWREDEYRMVKS